MKKNTTKRALALVCALTAGASAFAGCGGKKEDTEQTLELLLWDAGYGVEWCEKILEAFQAEAWVQEKYPNLDVIFTADSDSTLLSTKISAGEKGNTVDIFFGSGMSRYEGKDSSGKEMMADLTETVYNTLVPGENVTVKDKMDDSYVQSIRYYEKGQDSNSPDVPFKAYSFPWVGGMDSIMYNADHLKTIGAEVPLTTDQFLATCEKIVSEKPYEYNLQANGDYAIMTSSSGHYWYNLYPTWWAQYEGMEEYYNFCNGVANNRISADIHRQKGKLYSLEVFGEILEWDNGYVYQKRTGLDFMQAQTRFVEGEGVFYSNGDWFAKEMEQTVKDVEEIKGVKYDIRMMQVPVVSKIIEKTPSIPNDETLQAVIRAIDNGSDSIQLAKQDNCKGYELLAGVTEEDYQTVLAARGIVHSTGATHRALVPSYAKGKEIAFDFLRYMATDKAQEIYIEYTGGSSLPFEYDVQRKNPELYEKLLPIGKDYMHIKYNTVCGMNVLPDPNSFPLMKWGEMKPVYSLVGNSLVAYFASKESTGTAQQVYDDDIKYYIDGGNFNLCRDRAGLS